jgi:hypothetical protein
MIIMLNEMRIAENGFMIILPMQVVCIVYYRENLIK